MRERISKKTTGGNNIGRKEVRVKINKSGLSANGNQRYSLAIRFADGSHKKITSKGYVAVEIDKDIRRIYLVSADPDDGFKLTGKDSEQVKSITFTIYDPEDWRSIEGCYYLLKDPVDGSYYIDYSEEKEDK